MEQKLQRLSVAECAVAMGLPRTTLYRRIRGKKLAAVREGREWVIFALQIEDSKFILLPHSALPQILGPFADAYREG